MINIQHKLKEHYKLVRSANGSVVVRMTNNVAPANHVTDLEAWGPNDWPYITHKHDEPVGPDHLEHLLRVHISDLFKFASKIIRETFRVHRKLFGKLSLDFTNDREQEFTVHMEAVGDGIEIAIEGYGTFAGGKDDAVIYLDFYDGEPKLHLWTNASVEDPEQEVDFRRAKNFYLDIMDREV